MEKYEIFAALADKQMEQWSDEERDMVGKEAKEHGIKINVRCKDCWRDAAVQLAIIYKPEKPKNGVGGFALRDGVDVMLHSKHGDFHVCEATMTESNARKWLAAGLPTTFFAKMQDE